MELHPYLQQEILVRYCQSTGMHLTAYSPLGHGDSYKALCDTIIASINEKEVVDIAAKHGVSPAQVSYLTTIETLENMKIHIHFHYRLC